MKNKSNISLIDSIIFFVFGLFIFTNPDMLVKFISYFFGGVLLAIGIYKTVNYYIHDKRGGVVNKNEFGFGITTIILGVLFIFLAGTIELLIRFIIGAFIILAGIVKISNTFYTTVRDNRYYALFVIGIIYIGIGLYVILVSNLPLSIIGLLMMIYGIINFISYFVYKDGFYKKVEDNSIKEAELIEEKKDDENKKEK